MWVYQTLSHATHSVARHVVVRGAGCGGTNSCTLTLGNFATDFASVASGMDTSLISVTFYSQSTSIACSPLSTCYLNSTVWPPASDNAPGSDIRLAATCQFPNALAMFLARIQSCFIFEYAVFRILQTKDYFLKRNDRGRRFSSKLKLDRVGKVERGQRET